MGMMNSEEDETRGLGHSTYYGNGDATHGTVTTHGMS